MAVAVAGCATAPSGGPPRQAPGGSSQAQAYVQPLPPPGPTTTWEPDEVVQGFLHASASYAVDPAAARQYLVPALRAQWTPDQSVAVVGDAAKVQPALSRQPATLQLTGQHLATLSQTGQYQYEPGNVAYTFKLTKVNGVWLIRQLPATEGLILTQSDFEEVYQPRNLFFFAPPVTGGAAGVLVPDPVYAPLQSSNSALNTDLAKFLVRGLLRGQGSSSWLSGATSSAFPPGTKLVRVTIAGKSAQVYLGGSAAAQAARQPLVVANMLAQLQATLEDAAYSPPLVDSVRLYIGSTLQSAASQGNLVPRVATGPVTLVTDNASAVGQLAPAPKAGTKPTPLVSASQIGHDPVTAVALSPSRSRPQQLAVAVRSGRGCVLYVGPAGARQYQSYQLPQAGAGADCTSLSFDVNGDLWAAAGQRAWVLMPQGTSLVAVDLSALSLGPDDKLLVLRMAPDGVRAALLVQTPSGNRLVLAALREHGGRFWSGQAVSVGAGVTRPLALSWYDAYHLAVLTTGGIYEVPLTGGAGQPPGGAPQQLSLGLTGATTLTTDGAELVVETGQGQIFAAPMASLSELALVANGSYPTYPG